MLRRACRCSLPFFIFSPNISTCYSHTEWAEDSGLAQKSLYWFTTKGFYNPQTNKHHLDTKPPTCNQLFLIWEVKTGGSLAYCNTWVINQLNKINKDRRHPMLQTLSHYMHTIFVPSPTYKKHDVLYVTSYWEKLPHDTSKFTSHFPHPCNTQPFITRSICVHVCFSA